MNDAVREGTLIVERSSARREEPADQAIATRQQTAVAVATPMNLLQVAVQRGATIEEITKLTELYERWEANEARKAFAAAMQAFKANPPEIFKNKRVHFESRNGGATTDYWHATLDQVSSAIAQAMSPHGLSHRWETEQKEGGRIRVTCIVMHERGHRESVWLEGAPDNSGNKNSIQAVGSTVTYLQRYTLLAATGMAVSDQDDDGAGGERTERATGGGGQTETNGKPPFPEEQFKKSIAGWRKQIADGKKTPDTLIKMLSTRNALSEAQLQQIRGE